MCRKYVGRALILALMLSGATSMNAQKITRQFKNVPLKTVLAEVEKELRYSIIYKKDEVNEKKQITQDFEDASLEEVLSVILDSGLTYSVQGKMIIISKKAAGTVSPVAQQKKIELKGFVKDENGEPIVGANVLKKGHLMVRSQIWMVISYYLYLKVLNYVFPILDIWIKMLL